MGQGSLGSGGRGASRRPEGARGAGPTATTPARTPYRGSGLAPAGAGTARARPRKAGASRPGSNPVPWSPAGRGGTFASGPSCWPRPPGRRRIRVSSETGVMGHGRHGGTDHHREQPPDHIDRRPRANHLLRSGSRRPSRTAHPGSREDGNKRDHGREGYRIAHDVDPRVRAGSATGAREEPVGGAEDRQNPEGRHGRSPEEISGPHSQRSRRRGSGGSTPIHCTAIITRRGHDGSADRARSGRR